MYFFYTRFIVMSFHCLFLSLSLVTLPLSQENSGQIFSLSFLSSFSILKFLFHQDELLSYEGLKCYIYRSGENSLIYIEKKKKRWKNIPVRGTQDQKKKGKEIVRRRMGKELCRLFLFVNSFFQGNF